MFARYTERYDGMRSYDQLELAVNRGSAFLGRGLHSRAALQSNSGVELGTEYHAYHSGDLQVIANHAPA